MVSIGDPAALSLFGVSPNYAGSPVTENTVTGLSGAWRAQHVVSGTVAQLPLRTLRIGKLGLIERVQGSLLDNPGGKGRGLHLLGFAELTPFQWKFTILWHLGFHGNAYLQIVRNAIGQPIALIPVHPLLVRVYWPGPCSDPMDQPLGGKWFDVTDPVSGKVTTYDAYSIKQIMGAAPDGLAGLSVIQVARNSLGTAVSGDRAAAKLFDSGALMGGIISPDEDLDDGEAQLFKDDVMKAMGGWDNAGRMVVATRKMSIQPWTLSAADAQFLQSRSFQIEEIARWWGVPPHLLMQTEKQTSWGTGVAEQNRGLSRFTLGEWTANLEQELSEFVPRGQWVEFDFKAMERADPQTELNMIIQQVTTTGSDGQPLMTTAEARELLNLSPLPQEAGAEQDAEEDSETPQQEAEEENVPIPA